MTLRQIADSIGIGEYPEAMEQTFLELPQTDAPACDLTSIEWLQQQYNVFDKYYDLVMKTAGEVNEDPLRSLWVKVASAYALGEEISQAAQIPVPKADGTQITAMLPLFVLLPMIPESIAQYKRRGFPEEEIQQMVGTYWRDLRVLENQTGLPGLNRLYYRWLLQYAKCNLFKTCGLNFELRKLPDVVIYLRNRLTGQVLPLVTKYRFDATGTQRVGVSGFEDDRDAFEVTFCEDDVAFYGHAVYDCVVSRESAVFGKREWEAILRPGEPCLGMHIPTGADISPEVVNKAIASARKVTAERYPEFTGKYVLCSSWLLDPTLGKVLGPNANITRFQNMYCRYPQGGSGKAGFDRIFGRRTDDYSTLPEDTRLRRGIKQHYLDGKYLYSYAGLIV